MILHNNNAHVAATTNTAFETRENRDVFGMSLAGPA